MPVRSLFRAALFAGLVMAMTPFAFARESLQQRIDALLPAAELILPDGEGPFPVVIQMHYLNASDQPLDAYVLLNGHTYAAGADYQEAHAYVTYNDTININAYSGGVAGGGGVTISQSGADALIDLGGGNTILVLNTSAADPNFLSHIVW